MESVQSKSPSQGQDSQVMSENSIFLAENIEATGTSETPEFMAPVGYEFTLNTNVGGFSFSTREGSESSFTLSSDSTSESFMSTNKHLISPVVKNDESKVKQTKVHDPEVLLKKISTLEKEVVGLNKKIRNLSDENALLEAAEANVADLQDVIRKSNRKMETMVNVLEASRQQVLRGDDETKKLKQELSKKVAHQTKLEGKLVTIEKVIGVLNEQSDAQKARYLKLQEQVDIGLVDISKRDDEIKELNTKINLLKSSHEAQEDRWNTDIEKLKTELWEKCELIDELKLKVVELEGEGKWSLDMEAVESKSQSQGQDSQAMSENSIFLAENIEVTQTSETSKFVTPVGYEATLNTSGGGFSISTTEGSESSIALSSNSESESSVTLSSNSESESSVTLSSNSESESSMSINKPLTSPVKSDAPKVKGKATKVHDPEVLLKKISTLEEELSGLKKTIQNLTDENAFLEAEKANVAELKLMISASNRKIETMVKTLEASRKQVLTADDEISKLKQELSRKEVDQAEFLSLGQTITSLQEQLHSKQARGLELSEKIIKFTAYITKQENEITELNGKIVLLRISHAADEDRWNADIERLKTEVREKCELMDDLNQKLDDVTSYTDELKLKVAELEREMDTQREVMSEEKMEAIRQLSFTVEHYMSEYKQLRQEFVAYKRRPTLTSIILAQCFGNMEMWDL
ncbi:hypothetical protein L1887_08859 [Cichorium endivia]|nr:hypothetical protein L1887_08859 [Cichorium endivia]